MKLFKEYKCKVEICFDYKDNDDQDYSLGQLSSLIDSIKMFCNIDDYTYRGNDIELYGINLLYHKGDEVSLVESIRGIVKKYVNFNTKIEIKITDLDNLPYDKYILYNEKDIEVMRRSDKGV